MLEDSWCFYEERLPKRRMFHPRKRSFAAPFFTIVTAIAVIFEAVSHL
jgi:hypothetical protein